MGVTHRKADRLHSDECQSPQRRNQNLGFEELVSPLVVGLLDRLPGVPEALLVQVVEDPLVAGRKGARFDSGRPHGFRGRLAKVDRHPVRRTDEDESASFELAEPWLLSQPPTREKIA